LTLNEDGFRVLFVCTGNVCRSVIAERLARSGIRARLGDEAARFAVTSAGTASRDGLPMHPYTWLGADPEGFRSRQLTAADIDAADLILAAGAGHRDEVLTMCPRASTRSYLLREFARLAEAMPAAATSAVAIPAPSGAVGPAVQRARGAVAAAARLRGRIPYVEPAADEIPDPPADPEEFMMCAQLIEGALRPVLNALCGMVPAAEDGLVR
jgi:protein-tyrosine phosphatase